MKCEEAAEFVSALCDGEKIPRGAAEHVGACEVCALRLTEYAEMGAELRRVASLESTEPSPLTWGKQQRTKSNWWQKGWETMRIPRLAFAVLLSAILALGSGLVILKVRAQTQGQVLMLRVKPENGHTMLCPLTQDEHAPLCYSMFYLNSGLLIDGFRIISRDGDRVELGVRAGLKAFPAGARDGFSASLEDIQKLPESSYWLEPGEKLEVDVPGAGALTVTGEFMDHIPSIMLNDREIGDMDPGPGELRVISPVLLRDKQVVRDYAGLTSIIFEADHDVVYFYRQGEGLWVLSQSPLEGAVQGHVTLSRISFEMDGASYEFLTAAPVSRSETIWVLHKPDYRPSGGFSKIPDFQGFEGTGSLSILFPQAPAKN
jgi:hypothetical protein